MKNYQKTQYLKAPTNILFRGAFKSIFCIDKTTIQYINFLKLSNY